MGKISDYIEQELIKRQTATVESFARELGKSTEAFLEQLRAAGVSKASGTDLLTDDDKQKLLANLQRTQAPDTNSKTITIVGWKSHTDRLLAAVSAGESGAEWACFEWVASNVYLKDTIDPRFQAVVNLIVAKSYFLDALPEKKLGRPKSEDADSIGVDIAREYWQMRDNGVSYLEASEHLANKVHKDVRHIMRIVKEHTKSIGLTPEARARARDPKRQKVILVGNIGRDDPKSAGNNAMQSPDFSLEDYVEHIDELIKMASRSSAATDIK
jgi:hypothetical protein